MPPADAAPAAAEPPVDRPGDGTGATRTAPTGPGPVPPPRSAPPEEAVPAQAVPTGSAEVVPAQAVPTGSAEAVPAGAALDERDLAILAFEQQWWRHAGAKEQAIRDAFGLSATRYYQLLNKLLDNPAALAVEPVLVGRLRRLRSSRARNRRR
ncbi:DUF3263 domain-containing protein [Micromonospora krabiensis]|uniref:DUF3263 domain-containing protein n=1 Tax=Micromonospora krabiensis TaxID=307121 RepID=A0A1C3N9P2_9ACTN|nr:DUF3263 domain-containing protein [Micromonospora krabiensis]SBV29288.1 Protein of unknown function [Micromonospora krabiensis]